MKLSARLQIVLGVLLLPLVWFIVADWLELATPLILPPLKDVLARLWSLISSGEIFPDLYKTLYRWVLGFALGILVGVPCGLLLGTSAALYRVFELPIEFFRTLPVTAVFPLFLLIFGVGDEAKIAMAFFPTFLLLVVNTSYGVSHATPERQRMAKAFGASRLQSFRWITCREALPQIFIGLRLALSLSLIVTVVSEMFIGTEFGLGQRVYDSYLTNSVNTLYAILILLGLLGYGLNKLLILIEHKTVFWAGR